MPFYLYFNLERAVGKSASFTLSSFSWNGTWGQRRFLGLNRTHLIRLDLNHFHLVHFGWIRLCLIHPGTANCPDKTVQPAGQLPKPPVEGEMWNVYSKNLESQLAKKKCSWQISHLSPDEIHKILSIRVHFHETHLWNGIKSSPKFQELYIGKPGYQTGSTQDMSCIEIVLSQVPQV